MALTFKIELPDMPDEQCFGLSSNYRQALEAWERVCKAIIEANSTSEPHSALAADGSHHHGTDAD